METVVTLDIEGNEDCIRSIEKDDTDILVNSTNIVYTLANITCLTCCA